MSFKQGDELLFDGREACVYQRKDKKGSKHVCLFAEGEWAVKLADLTRNTNPVASQKQGSKHATHPKGPKKVLLLPLLCCASVVCIRESVFVSLCMSSV